MLVRAILFYFNLINFGNLLFCLLEGLYLFDSNAIKFLSSATDNPKFFSGNVLITPELFSFFFHSREACLIVKILENHKYCQPYFRLNTIKNTNILSHLVKV